MIRKILILFLMTIFVLPLTASAHDTVKQPRLVTVNGEAEIKVVPDEVTLHFSIQTWNQELEKAKEDNDQRIQKTINIIKTFKLDPKKVQSGHITIIPGQPNPSYYDNKIRGYLVNRDIVIILNDISIFDSLVEKLFASGVNSLSNVNFQSTELEKHRNRARLLAVKNAQIKAMAMSKTLGEKLDRVYSINELNNYWTSPYRNMDKVGVRMMAMESSGGGQQSTVSLGEISIVAQVNVSFELKD